MGLRQPSPCRTIGLSNAEAASDRNGIGKPALELVQMRLNNRRGLIFPVLAFQKNQLSLDGEETLLQVVVQDLRDAMAFILLCPRQFVSQGADLLL